MFQRNDNPIDHRIWFLMLTAYCGLIFYLSGQSHLLVPFVFNFQDKLVHALAYAVMAVLFWKTFACSVHAAHRIALAAVMFCLLYGASDEWHQSFVAGRDASVGDWLADTLGAMLISIVFWYGRVHSTARYDRRT